jgi:hypothetical protein
LPRKSKSSANGDTQSEDNKVNWVSSDLDTEDELDETIDHVDTSKDSEDERKAQGRDQDSQNTDQAPTNCPHPKCPHKKSFSRRMELERHFESRTIIYYLFHYRY